MGVPVRLVAYAKDEETARAACKAAYDRVGELDEIMSDYLRDSELNRLCMQAGRGPVKVSPELLRVLDYAQDVSQRSDGVFDVTVGPVVALWRQARKTGKLPTPASLEEARSKVGWRLMKLDPAAQTVELPKPGMKLDLGGIGKGYAGDEAIRVLQSHGIDRALYEAGGDIVVSAAPPGTRGWTIELPSGDKVTLANEAVSTSGDTVQYVEIDGRRYSHVVDPSTGLGVSEHFMTTVTAPRGITADSLSTAATILGPGRGDALIHSFRAKGIIRKSS